MNKKGFTLIELLAVLVIIGIVFLIAVPGVTKIIKKTEMDAFNANLKSLAESAENHYKVNAHLLPLNLYENMTVSLDFLVREGLIDEIKNPVDSSIICKGYVIVRQPQLKKYTYDPYLNCGNKLISENYQVDIENPGIVTIINDNVLEVIGKDKNNISFAGENNYAELSSPLILGEDFTVEYWFKTNLTNNFRIINGSTNAYSVWHTGQSTISLDNPRVDITLSTPFVANEWQHIAITRMSNFVRVYRNGKEVGTGTWSGELRPLKIGGKTSNTAWSSYNGSVSDVRVWTVARTPQQIRNSMYYGLKGNERGLLGYWPLTEGEGTAIHDVTNNNNATLYSSSWSLNNGIRRIRIDNEAWLYKDRHIFDNLSTGTYTLTVEDNVGNTNSTVVNIP